MGGGDFDVLDVFIRPFLPAFFGALHWVFSILAVLFT